MELLHSTKMNPLDKSEINFDVSYDSIQVRDYLYRCVKTWLLECYRPW